MTIVRRCPQGEEEDSPWSNVGPGIHILNSGGEEDQVEGVPHMRFNMELGRYQSDIAWDVASDPWQHFQVGGKFLSSEASF